jgi:hypothetical protein
MSTSSTKRVNHPPFNGARIALGGVRQATDTAVLIGSVVVGHASFSSFSAVARLAVVAILLDTTTLRSQRTNSASGISEAAMRFLADRLPVSASDLREVKRGQPVVRTLEAPDGREVATVGMVAVGVPARFYMEQLRDIAFLKNASRAVLAVGTFATPATIDDLTGLSLDPGELNNLQRCRLHACNVQLSGEGIELIRHRVDASGGDAPIVADRAFRKILIDLVNRYRERGDAALMTYADSERPTSVAAEFRAMVGSGPAILPQLPPLYRHLSSFPRRPSSVDDILYWSKEKLGPAVVVTVTHLAIAQLSDGRFDAFAAASKQIYGSRYFDSSLGITVVVDAGARQERPRSLLVYVNRSRIDALGGFWGVLKRAVVRARTRSSMRDSLSEVRTIVERRFGRREADTPPSP